jgi:hypothetical protein
MTDPKYPEVAGWKEETTSRENAERIEGSGKAQTLRRKVMEFFENGRTATADEVALVLGEPFRAVQPRVSELRAVGLVEPTGLRGIASGGGTCHIWRKTVPQTPRQ